MAKNVIQVVAPIGEYGLGYNYAKYLLEDAAAGPLNFEVSSLGGDLNQAKQVKKLFVDRGDVTVDFFGYCASAVTILGHGAANSRIYSDAFFLVHKPLVWVDTWGSMNADDLEQAITELQSKKMDAEVQALSIAKEYVENCGIELNVVMDLMKNPRWLTPQEAVDYGFVNEIIPATTSKKANVSNEIMAMISANQLPALPTNSTEPDKEDTLVQKIVNAINPFKPSKTPAEMNKDFTFVNQVLGVEGVEVKNETVTIPVAQISLFEARIKADADKITNLTTERDAAKTNMDSFTNKVDEIDATVKAAATPEAKVAAITAKLASRPAAQASAQQSNGGEGSATDTVNWDEMDKLPHNQAADKDYVPQSKK